MLQEIADVLKMDGVAFKPQAYERAAEAIRKLPEPFTKMYEDGGIKALKDISGVGASIAEKLEELAEKGSMQKYEEIKQDMPADVEGLKRIEGIGVKSIQRLYRELGIKTVEELAEAAKKKKIRELDGFGEKTEEKILESVAFHQSRGGRFPLHEAATMAGLIVDQISAMDGVERVAVAGSIRRGRETVGDADILVVAKDGEAVGKRVLALDEVEHEYGLGETKTMVRLKNGMDLDVRVIEPDAWGAALNYFTGSREHNVHLRKIAQEKGLTLNEYGLAKASKKGSGKAGNRVAGSSEEELYRALDLAYVEPELREDRGEIEEAQEAFARGKAMPRLVTRSDLKGDLQTQSDWTDGKNSIEELAYAAKDAGLSYIAITDHTKSLSMMGGLDGKAVRRQMTEIDRLNKRMQGITILKGTECDILRDGSLDLPDEVLRELDVVGVSVHSHFNLSEKEQTDRIIRAMENPNVDILFHPTGRIVGRRPPYALDIRRVITRAVELGVVLEVNGSSRLDLHAEHVRLAREQKAKLVVSSDAHAIEHFSFLNFGIQQARRGGAQKADVINTRTLAHVRKLLRSNNA